MPKAGPGGSVQGDAQLLAGGHQQFMLITFDHHSGICKRRKTSTSMLLQLGFILPH